MVRKKLVKIELSNTRYVRSELKDHASEFILYARYAGYVLNNINEHLSTAKLYPLKPDIAERNHKIILETTLENAKILQQITQIYPSFSSWRIKMVSPKSASLLETTSKVKSSKKAKPKRKKPSRKVKKSKPKKSAKKKKKTSRKAKKSKKRSNPKKLSRKPKKKAKKKKTKSKTKKKTKKSKRR